MPISLAVNSVTATSVTLGFTGAGPNGTIEVQLSARPDFEWCVSPIYTLALAGSGSLQQLNQDASYYARARNRPAAGVPDAWSSVVAFRTPLSSAPNTAPQAIMNDAAIIVLPEPVTDWVALSEQDGYPLRNLGRDAPVAWHGSLVSGLYVFEFRTAGAPIDTLALMNTNLPEAATWRAKAGADQANVRSGSPAFNSGSQAFRASANIPGRRGYHGLMQLATPQAYPYWRIEISATCPGSMIHAEHFIAGLNRKSRTHALEKRESGTTLGSMERTRSGAPDRQEGYRMREVEFDIAFLTETQYETLYHDLAYRLNDPILVVPNSRAGAFLHDRMLYGDLGGGQVVQTHTPRYTRTFKVNSLI